MKYWAAVLAVLVSPAAWAQDNQCLDNYVSSGTFLTGRTYSTYAEYNVDASRAYDAVLGSIRDQDFDITSSAPESGTILARQIVPGGSRTAPLTARVDSTQNGTRIGVTFKAASGMMVDERGVKDGLCAMVRAASR